MKTRLLIVGRVTSVISIALYDCRAFTFAVWTNAAIIGHSYPKLIVSAIEFWVVVIVGAIAWIAVWSVAVLLHTRRK